MSTRTAALASVIVVVLLIGFGLPALAARSATLPVAAVSPSAPASVSPAIAIGPIGPGVAESAYIYPNCTVFPSSLFVVAPPEFALTGNWAGSILDECAGSVLNGSDHTITSSSSFGYGVEVNTTSDVTVANLTVTGSPEYGIEVRNSSDVSLFDVEVTPGIDAGIYALGDSDLVTDGAQTNGSAEYGIYYGFVEGGSISASYAEDSEYGFASELTTGLTIQDSNGSGSAYAAYVGGDSNVSIDDDNLSAAGICGVYELFSTTIHVANVTATHARDGVCSDGTSDSSFWDSDFADATLNGINATLAGGLTAVGLNLSGAGHNGALLTQSTGGQFVSDAANGTGHDGFDVENSSTISIAGSWASQDDHNGLRVASSTDIDSEGNTYDNGTSATANGTSIFHSSDLSLANDTDTGDLVGVYDTGSTDLVLSGLNASSDYEGYTLINDHAVTLENSTAFDDTFGALLVSSVLSDVSNLTVVDPVEYGVVLELGDSDALVNSTILGSAGAPVPDGIYLIESTNDTLVNDTIENVDDGLYSQTWLDSTVDDLTVLNAVASALLFIDTYEVTIESGNFSSSAVGFTFQGDAGGIAIVGNSFFNDSLDFAFSTQDLYGIQVYWNNFVDGGGWSVHVVGNPNASIAFADGYPAGGNYWSNDTTPDSERGPQQNQAGADGIVDHPLTIQGPLEDPYPLTQPISLADLDVVFVATGLPNGTAWSVTFNGTTTATTSDSLTVSTGTAATGIVYDWEAGVPAGYRAIPGLGHVITDGATHIIDVKFLPLMWPVTFGQTGLGPSASWTVTINGTQYAGLGSSLTIDLANGTYPYTVTPVAGYLVSPASGNLTVTPAGVTVNLVYSELVYTVSFTERGLPEGTSWTVTFGGTTKSLPSSTISFSVPNGTYTYGVTPIAGYTLAGGNGSHVVAGPGGSVFVAFASSPASSTGFDASSPLFWALIAVIAVLAIALIAALVWGRRKPASSAAPWSPPPPGGATVPAPSAPSPESTPPPGATTPDWKE